MEFFTASMSSCYMSVKSSVFEYFYLPPILSPSLSFFLSYRWQKVYCVEICGRPLLIRNVIHPCNVLWGELERLEARLQDLDGRRVHNQNTPQKGFGLDKTYIEEGKIFGEGKWKVRLGLSFRIVGAAYSKMSRPEKNPAEFSNGTLKIYIVRCACFLKNG